MYGDLATTNTAVKATPARTATPSKLARAMKFALRWKICAMSELRLSEVLPHERWSPEVVHSYAGQRMSGSISDR